MADPISNVTIKSSFKKLEASILIVIGNIYLPEVVVIFWIYVNLVIHSQLLLHLEKHETTILVHVRV